jgi:hypothetical protein
LRRRSRSPSATSTTGETRCPTTRCRSKKRVWKLKLKQEPSSILLFFRIFLSTKNNFRRSDNLNNYFLFLLLLLKNVSLTNICLIVWRNHCSNYYNYKKKLFLSIRVLTPELKENPSL